eukprot:TRINITY_DN9882_c0_g1_i1.p1 TRINITY_DN9882_c0_g1~~TRINITY_DN9882_c0_g1_i1.p1  ORF type:complete len:352 (-),score=70.61 TRINITY_DN9882_c0_g1_i1:242-1297(-)
MLPRMTPVFRRGLAVQGRKLASSINSQFATRRHGSLAAMSASAAVGLGLTWQVSKPAVSCEATVNWDEVRKEIVKILEDDSFVDSSYEGAHAGPLFLRLAWHSAGTFCACTKTGGSDGATMRFEPEISWGANAGLAKAQKLLEPVKKKFPSASYSDLWIFAACVAIEEMGGSKVPFTPGRVDKPDGRSCPVWEGATHKDGRLPSADMGSPDKTAAHLRYIFNRMGFDDKEIVALSGAHGLGACHVENSGFWGPWTRAPTTVSNEYYRELLENTWTIKTTHKGKPWNGPLQFEDPTGDLMMLPSDIVLIQDREFRKHVECYAKNDAAFQKDFAAVVGKLFALGCNPQKKGWF